MKHYKAIFFDWDGTAVLSRKAPVEDAVNAMRPLLDQGVKLCIVSGTTYENIAGGKLHSYFTPKQLENLYLGLGRGAFDYGYDATGQPTILVDRVPDAKGILAVHDACYRIHRELLEKYGMNTDIVFSRPNYCKIDLMPANNRGENLFLQEGEAACSTSCSSTALTVLKRSLRWQNPSVRRKCRCALQPMQNIWRSAPPAKVITWTHCLPVLALLPRIAASGAMSLLASRIPSSAVMPVC